MLKPRHIEVLRLAGAGCTIDETAEVMDISAAYVRHLRSDAMRMLGKHTITGAVVMALRCSALSLGDCINPR